MTTKNTFPSTEGSDKTLTEGKATEAQKPLRLNPSTTPFETYSTKNSELVIGIVGPIGTDNTKIRHLIEERLSAFKYDAYPVHVSKTIIPALAGPDRVEGDSAFERAMNLIDLGNRIREESANPSILAIASAAEIARLRPEPDGEVKRIAFIVSTIKRREEVAEFRKIYGNGFYLFAVHGDAAQRIGNLQARDGGMVKWQAEKLVERDEHEPGLFGQDTRGTFHLADFFIADEQNDDKLNSSIVRCLDLIFGHPHLTPTFHEFAMFMAFSASVRSADLSRQVGAVVARDNEILSTGANDCPAPDGGLYWPDWIGNCVDDVPRGRDYKRGNDSNTVEKLDLVENILNKCPDEWRPKLSEALKDSAIKDITEYGRVVHAEMESLLACGRVGVSPRGATLYCTTFPCHNCAKHIIAAGIERVIYIEPYPKSKALKFHDDAVTAGKVTTGEHKVQFEPFIGIGPRVFFNLFSMSLGEGRPVARKDDVSGMAVPWIPEQANPRVQMLPFAHRRFEEAAKDYLKRIIEVHNDAKT